MSASTAAGQAGVASSVKSADRLMTLLEYLADVGEATFQSITTDLSLPNSSAHQLLLNVTRRGFAEYNATSRMYRLGIRVWELGQAYNRAGDLATLAQPLMDDLVGVVDETVQLARLDGMEEVHIAISETSHPVKLYSAVGLRLPAHVTGLGKALLSGLTDAEIRDLYRDAELERFTDKTITDVERLILSIHKIRSRGQGGGHRGVRDRMPLRRATDPQQRRCCDRCHVCISTYPALFTGTWTPDHEIAHLHRAGDRAQDRRDLRPDVSNAHPAGERR